MKFFLKKFEFCLIILIFILTSSSFKPSYDEIESVCLSAEEKKLYELIMDYRKSKNLPRIPVSPSLTYVAKTHAQDLKDNYTLKDPCNPHSWSGKGRWKECCYYADHRNAKCMWDKPRELTSYTSDGFEIAYFHSDKVVAGQALEAWKKSKGHNMVIVNLDIWKKVNWKAIGIGIHQNYATVWFGATEDKEGKVELCPEQVENH